MIVGKGRNLDASEYCGAYLIGSSSIWFVNVSEVLSAILSKLGVVGVSFFYSYGSD